MKFTDPVTRLFFFIEMFKAVMADHKFTGNTATLLSTVGEIDPACLSAEAEEMQIQADELFRYVTGGKMIPGWLVFDGEEKEE